MNEVLLKYAKINYPDIWNSINLRASKHYLSKKKDVRFDRILEQIEEKQKKQTQVLM